MVPAPRENPDDLPSPPDLAHLALLYQALPHPSVRWQTEPGIRFLDALFLCVDRWQVKGVAGALQISTPGVYYMMERKRPAHPRRWPTPEDLRDINAAWRIVRTVISNGRSVRRTSAQYRQVHAALLALLERQFTLRDVALAMKVPSRQLARFAQPPLRPPDVARALGDLLPAPASEP